MMKYTYIYLLVDPRDNKPRYVGKANNPKQRLQNHLNPARYKNTHKFNWIKKLKKDEIIPSIIILEKVLVDRWREREKFWIRFFIKKGYNLVNNTTGGDGLSFGNNTSFKRGHVPWNKGTANKQECVVCGIEFYAPVSAKRYTCSKECASEIRQGHEKTQFKRGHVPWNKGKKGYSINSKGKKMSQEVKDKISKALLGKDSKKKRPVKQYDKNMKLINHFDSITEAEIFTGIKGIGNVLCGRAKTAGGYIWV